MFVFYFFLGLPFLISSPSAYLVGAFNVGRVFMHKWTVNWRFLSEEIFVDRRFHFALLGLHIFLILIFLPEWTKYLKSFARLCKIEKDLFSKKGKKKDDQQVQGKVCFFDAGIFYNIDVCYCIIIALCCVF